MSKYFKVPIEVWESRGNYIDKILYIEILQKKGSVKMPEGYFVSKFSIQQVDEESSISRLLLANYIILKYKRKSRYLLPFTEKKIKQKSEYADQIRDLLIWSKQQGFPQQGTSTINSRFALLLLKKVGLEKAKDLVSLVLDFQTSDDNFLPRVFDFAGIYYKIASIENAAQRVNKNQIVNIDCG
ncbi:MAG: hypothetical protein WC648_04155 [Candidatus Paceibacterota bacterium]